MVFFDCTAFAIEEIILDLLHRFFYFINFSGMDGGIMLIGVVYFIRNYPVKIAIRNIIPVVFLFLSILMLLPVFDAFKWGFRVGMSFDGVLDSISNMDYFYIFPIVFQSVVDRFQNFHYVVYALQERSNLLDEILSGNVNWFF